MAQRWTTVRASAAGNAPGLQLPGNVSRADAIMQFRKVHERHLEEAKWALSVADEGLVVESANGVYRRKNIRQVTE